MSRLPIRLRLTVAFVGVMAGVLAGMGVLVYLRVGGALLATVDQTLRSQAVEAVAHARKGERELLDRDVAGGTTLAERLSPTGALLGSSRAGLPPLLARSDIAALQARSQLIRSIRLRRPAGDWRLLAVRDRRAGIVVVARSLEPREESLHRLFRELVVAVPLALLLASFAGYALAAAALRPVEAMRRRATAITGTSSSRLPVPRSRDEVSRLAETLNAMLERLEESVEHERRFVADASHELRTPLALMRTELELALRRRRTQGELEAALRSAGDEAERLSRLVDGLLLLARADSDSLPLRRDAVSTEELLATVARRFAPRAQAVGARIDVDTEDFLLVADSERLEQALGNLVDNALACGAHSVVLNARRDGERLELHALDDGPGFPDVFLQRAFHRFSRADDARGRGGAGLGLSIVALVAQAHGGSAGAANRLGRGADVWLTIPTTESSVAAHAPALI
jgi:signal transduction histidine kinase